MKEEQQEETEGESDEEEDDEDYSNSEDGHLHMDSAEDTAVHDYTAQEVLTTTDGGPTCISIPIRPDRVDRSRICRLSKARLQAYPTQSLVPRHYSGLFLSLFIFNRRGDNSGP